MGNAGCALSLLRHGADPEEKSGDGGSCLACRRDEKYTKEELEDVCRAMISKGADANRETWLPDLGHHTFFERARKETEKGNKKWDGVWSMCRGTKLDAGVA